MRVEPPEKNHFSHVISFFTRRRSFDAQMIDRPHRFLRRRLIHSNTLLHQPLAFLGPRFPLRYNVQSATADAVGMSGAVAVLDAVRGAVGGRVGRLLALAGEDA
jgi:hypothetical protein